tara:strand:- start:954 stop:1718 length:765 start_codon:yes stop_codon:yes gene_type:complete
MAKDWKTAQNHEKQFWENIYVKNNSDDIYRKTDDEGWKQFANEVLFRHSVNINTLNNKTILDLGSGPAGVAKGLHLMIKNNLIKNSNVIAADPLMDFYKKEICILKEDEKLRLLNNQGEKLDIKDKSVDIIFSTNVLDHCENPEELINECFRILKPNGIFFPSVHLVYNYLGLVSPLIKYFDTNHPHHFTSLQLQKKLKKKFQNVIIINKFTIKHDQKEFTFKNIFKGNNFFRSLKRFLSNFILYTCYFQCKKN